MPEHIPRTYLKMECINRSRMKVSLIVSTYNSPLSLKKVLESLGNQTRPADEVIIADDGSDDETASVIRAFSESARWSET